MAGSAEQPDPPRAASLPLIPLLNADEALGDRRVLATWHEALSDALGVEVPHELFALWLYPEGGGAELLGPEELAQDHLPVPIPNPNITDEQATGLAGLVQRAGYGSVACLPIRFGQRDTGLMLVAELRPDRYGERERELLARAAAALGPALGRIAQQWRAARESGTDLVAAITAAWADARSPRDFFCAVSRALVPALPHDLFEVLIPGPAAGQQYRLGAHPGGPPLADPALAIGRERLDLVALFADEASVVLDDVGGDPRWPAGLLAEDLPPGQEVRSLVGVRVVSSGHLAAHLLVASAGARLYQLHDVRLLERMGNLLAPKIDAYVLSSQLHVLRRQLGTLRNAPAHLARIADMLATTRRFPEATRRLLEEVRAMLPCDRLTLAVRLTEGDRVVMLEPGETKHLADLPPVRIAGTTLGQVVRGELADALTETPKQTELAVPLRAGGRTIGALMLTASGFGAITRADVVQVQQLADLLAPHVELVRRAAMLPAPVIPRRKQVT